MFSLWILWDCQFAAGYVPFSLGSHLAAPWAAGALVMLAAAPVYADKFVDAAMVLSQTSPPSLEGFVWMPDVYAKLSTQKQFAVIWASGKMFVMGLLWSAALWRASCSHLCGHWLMDSNLVATLADYYAINSAAGRMIASALSVDELSWCSCTERFAVITFG